MNKSSIQYLLTTIALIFFLMLPLEIFSQNLVNMMPQAYNPAFVGSMDAPRIALVNPFFAPTFGTPIAKRRSLVKMIAYDQSIQLKNTLKLGLGLRYSNVSLLSPSRSSPLADTVFTSNSYVGQINYLQNKATFNNYCFTLAPKFSFNGKHTISLASDFILQNVSWDYQKQYYEADTTAPFYRDGALVQSYLLRTESAQHYNKNTLLIKTGILYNTEKGYLGLTYTNYRAFKELNFQVARTFQRSKDSKFSFTPSATASLFWDLDRNEFSIKRSFQLTNLNLQFRWNKNYFGTNNIGLFYARQIKNLKIGVSVSTSSFFEDKNFNKQSGLGRFAKQESYSSLFELSARYIFKKKK